VLRVVRDRRAIEQIDAVYALCEPAGAFGFPLFLHDTDRILITASAPDFAPDRGSAVRR